MANEPGIATLLSGGALFGTVLAALGLRKMINSEVKNNIGPLQSEISGIKTDMSGVHQRLDKTMFSDEHKTICRMNAKNVDQKIMGLENTTQLQFDGLKDHIDIKFNAIVDSLTKLNARMDQRREEYSGD